MGNGASSEQPSARIPQPPSTKVGGSRTKKHLKNEGPSPTTGNSKKDLSGVQTNGGDATPIDISITMTNNNVVNPLSSKAAPPMTPTTGPGSIGNANYASLLQQHQQQQINNGITSQQSNSNQSGGGQGGGGGGGHTQGSPTGNEGPSDAELLGKKATFRQVIKRALELAQDQRQRYGKFRKDEKRAVMELYECLGLDEDTFLAPPNELQKRISNFRFPPPNMHMLRDVPAIDEETLEYILGPEESRLRKSEGLEVGPALHMKRGLDVEGGQRRVGVSSEATQTLLRSNPVFKNIPKNKDQGDRLWTAIHQCALFKGLETNDKKILFDAFEQEGFDAGTSVFDQGDEGDKFYLIDNGRCHVLVRDPQGREVHSLFLGDGDTFGELAIMYGTPRAATVTAVVDTVCWWIDRDTYRGTLLKETIRKRDKYIKFLESVPLFQNVDAYEKARIADVLEVQEVVGKGTVIIREGEPGDTFYLIEEGEVKFETIKDGEVFERRKAGSFFGEMALLFDRPRMATVISTTPTVRLLTLNRTNFTGYLGPLDEILRRNAEQYKHYVAKAQGTSA